MYLYLLFSVLIYQSTCLSVYLFSLVVSTSLFVYVSVNEENSSNDAEEEIKTELGNTCDETKSISELANQFIKPLSAVLRLGRAGT